MKRGRCLTFETSADFNHRVSGLVQQAADGRRFAAQLIARTLAEQEAMSTEVGTDIMQWRLLVLCLPLMFVVFGACGLVRGLISKRRGRELPWWPTLATAFMGSLASYVLLYRWLFALASRDWPTWTGLG